VSNKLTIEEVERRLYEIHGDMVMLDKSTYKDVRTKCRFIDKECGEWWVAPHTLFSYKCGHPDKKMKKMAATNLKLYGNICSLRDPTVQEKSRQSNMKHFGCFSPFGNKEIQEKSKQTNLRIFGPRGPSNDECVKEKKRQTNLRNRGFEYPAQSEEVREKYKQSCLCHFGAPHPMKNPEIALKVARHSNNSLVLKHWFSNEDVVCIASYEVAVIEYLNSCRIDYNWQPQIFTMYDGRTYRPDLYLSDLDIWVEIKGYFRGDAQEKWEWFHKEYPNSELWEQKKLKEIGIL
jgi:hypothetical protein